MHKFFFLLDTAFSFFLKFVHFIKLNCSWQYVLKIREKELIRNQFLLQNLFDNDVNCPIGKQELYLSKNEDSHFNSLMHLYASYSALSEWARDIQENVGYEISNVWMSKIESANQHMFEKVIPYFDKYDREIIYLNFPRIYAAVARTVHKHDPFGNIIIPDTDEISTLKIEK